MATNQEASTVTVTLKQGTIRGRIVKLSENLGRKRYFSFQGIPYAQPPTGQLRFKAPVAAKPWKGVFDAFIEGSSNVQKDLLFGTFKILGDEDCLFINVYVPEHDHLRESQKLPIMVWIHGGSFLEGSGDTNIYGPEFFMRKGNVILVTINYRLGPLGFLNLGTDKIPGNAGLQDQVFALQWIQENILPFRGDPDNVTIFGCSAGGSSVHYLLLSPKSKNLFHRAIIESGSALNPWAYLDKTTSVSRTINFAKGLGCTSADLDEIADFLLKIPSQTLVEKQNDFVENATPLLHVTFLPTSDSSSKNPILPENLNDLMKTGKFNKVPVMIGCNAQEGLLANLFLNIDKNLLSSKLDELLPKTLSQQFFDSLGEINEKKKEEIFKKIRKFYFKNKPINKETFQEFLEYFSDTMFLVGIKKTIDHFSEFNSNSPLFVYLFDYDGELGFIKNLLSSGKTPLVAGPSHGDEVGYLFRAHQTLPEPKPNSLDLTMVDRMIDMWTSFATNGNPSENLNLIWEPYSQKSHQVLRINSTLSVEKDFFNERLNFWERISKEI